MAPWPKEIGSSYVNIFASTLRATIAPLAVLGTERSTCPARDIVTGFRLDLPPYLGRSRGFPL